MKHIKYEEKFEAADGQPFTILDPDIAVQKKAREDARIEKKERYELPTIECTFAQAICWFVNNIPFDKNDKGEPSRKLTPEDTGNAYATIKAFRNAKNGYVELEDSVYTWLAELNEIDGPIAFRITQAVVAERLDNIKREPETKE